MNVKKINLMDIAFLIPVRIDSIVRLENLLASINYLNKYFNTNIYVLEANSLNNRILEKQLPLGVSYTYVKDTDLIFHRTRYINFLVQKSIGKYVAIWDADVIVNFVQIRKAIFNLRNNKCDVVFPYDGRFFDTTAIIREVYLKNEDFSVLCNSIGKMELPYGCNMGGGALFIKRDLYEKAGREDEEFYGWGPEDWNRVEKWKKLGYRIKRIEGPLFHLTHPRNLNGRHNSEIQKRYSYNILRSTQAGNVEDIKAKLNVRNSDFFIIPHKLHIGCGPCILPNWLNVDICPCSKEVMFMDASKPFPFSDNYFSLIFSEHMIEHISFENAVSMLHEIYRVLKPEGVLRISTPSFKFLEELYSHATKPDKKKYAEWSIKSFCSSNINEFNFAEKERSIIVINNFFNSWGHQFIYSQKIIETVLYKIGFKNIRKCHVGHSIHKDLNNIEQHGKQIPEWANLMETMVFEAQKGNY